MEEIRLWKVGGPNDSPTVTDVSNVNNTQSEEWFEQILTKSPSLLANGLKYIGR
jgi:hypothetical protein